MNSLLILYAESWGLLGNANAALGLARRLREAWPEIEIDLCSGEEVWPEFADWGRRISELSASLDAASVARDYHSLTRDITARVGLWPDQQALHEPAKRLTDRLANADSKVIATKGLLARLAMATGRAQVTNWITNPGLLGLPFHRCLDAHATCVPLEGTAERLTQLGVAPETISVTGPSIEMPFNRAQMIVTQSGASADTPILLIYSPSAVPDSVSTLIQSLPTERAIEIVLITHAGDKRDWNAALPEARFPPMHVTVYPGLSHHAFLALLDRMRAAKDRVLVTKSGPNTVFEVIELGIPLVVYRSGLPMEEWIPSFVIREGIGAVAGDWNHLGLRISEVLGKPQAQSDMVAAQARLRSRVFGDRSAIIRGLQKAVAAGSV
ncbi:MAG: hypothetical protein ACSHX3_16035 [Litorimonas sp.]